MQYLAISFHSCSPSSPDGLSSSISQNMACAWWSSSSSSSSRPSRNWTRWDGGVTETDINNRHMDTSHINSRQQTTRHTHCQNNRSLTSRIIHQLLVVSLAVTS